MKTVLNLALASALAASSLAIAAPEASAKSRHHDQHEHMCMDANHVLPLLFVGAALGAVTGGVGSAVAWGSAYAVGGAAVGGGTGLLLSTAHAHDHCNY
jgi:hypothetical protein